ncbi:MAG TPA: PilZ domain-containing protein [Phycisphaerae bacterium]|nr:PilZ domain-containing protein [Phycisphaerae bacterium]
MSETSNERRQHIRHPMATTVEMYHGPSGRQFTARTVDMSRGGVLIYLPAATPVAPGHPVLLSIGSPGRPELGGLCDQPVEATIVRVDRNGLLQHGHLPVGVRFTQPTAQA